MLESLLTEQGLEYRFDQQKSELSTSSNPTKNSKSSFGSLPQDKKDGMFPTRAFLNVFLIILTTAEVLLIVNSHVYMHSELLHSFMTIYADQGTYPDLFSGDRFYLEISNLTELQSNINYIVDTIAVSQNTTMINMDFENANIFLRVQYLQTNDIREQQQYLIDPKQGILQPFDSRNITDLKQFLMKVHHFQISVENLTLQTEGLCQKYIHRVNYRYDRGHEINVAYDFQIDNALLSNFQIQRPQANFLIYLRLFYLTVFAFALVSFYSNVGFIRRTFKEFSFELENHSKGLVHESPEKRFNKDQKLQSEIGREELQDISEKIHLNIEVRHITLSNQKWQDYFTIIQFDIVFSALSNILQMVGNAYLLFGREHEDIVGLGCLLSWLTVFRIFRSYRKLNLMYELIKMSVMSVIQFLISFFIVFLGYTFLGMCLFPKVLYFCQMSYAVTTLSSMMAGDSIHQFTTAITQKYSTILAILYIFSYVIMFMHAIHNTLTGIIKQYFILQKIQLLKEKKRKKKQEGVTFLQEAPTNSQKQLEEIRFEMKEEDVLFRLRNTLLQKINKYDRNIRILVQKLEYLISSEKWEIYQCNFHQHQIYQKQLRARLRIIADVLQKMQNDSILLKSREILVKNQVEGSLQIND